MADDAAETPKPSKYGRKPGENWGERWMERIRASETREKDWARDAEEAEKAYACDSKSKHGKLYDFNILHSNIETIVPAIYNSTPVPDIRRRWVKAGGKAPEQPKPPAPPQGMPQQGPAQQPQPGQPTQQPQQPQDPQATLKFQQDQRNYQMQMAEWQQAKAIDDAARDFGTILERAIAHQIDDNRLDHEVESVAQDAFLSGRGILRLRFHADIEGGGELGPEVASNERITFEAVSWRDFRMGPGNRWEGKSWIAFRHCLPREELEEFQDNDLVNAQIPAGGDSVTNEDDDIYVWEVWCKKTKMVHFVSEEDGKILKEEEDPLGLPGFYPIPEPVQPIKLTGKFTPVCPFTVYKKLANELDLCTRRINKIMEGLKVRGIVAGDVSSILRLKDADDNELVVESNLEQLAQTQGGLTNAIAWWPVEQAVAVLQQLYAQREQIRAAIYEITGISDIVRGASDARETLGAQEIKTKWGALRIQKMQRLIERQVRDVFNIMADIVVGKFSPETLQKMTGIQITPGIQELLQQSPSESYRIDVESDSTVRADLSREKAEMSEFLNGTGAFFKTLGPLIQQAPQIAEPTARIYGSFARVFRLGRDAEMALDEMAEMAKNSAKQPKPSPEEIKHKSDMELKQMELQAQAQSDERQAQIAQQQTAMTMQIEERKAQLESAKAQSEMQIQGINVELKQIDREIKLIELQIKQTQANAAVVTAMAPEQSGDDDHGSGS
jgi:hypothetical protein